MDEDKKRQSGSLNRRHFARIHEKIQNKYLQMQKRLDKSRSMDCLSTVNSDFDIQQQKNTDKSENKEPDKVSRETKSEIQTATCKIIVEDVNKSDAVFQEVNCYESNVSDNESVLIRNDDHEDYLSTQHFFGDDFKTSSESLNDSFKFSEENGKLPTPSRKTIRDKISNKILASKEKRREKEMNEAKRRESKDNIGKRVDSFESDIYETGYVMVGNDQKEEDYLTTRHEDNFKSSFESLNEASKEIEPCTPTKISIRNKISNKLLANKEKRKEKERKKESRDKIEKFVLSNSKKNKVATVTVALIDATILDNEVDTTVTDEKRLYLCRLRLGSEKRKSKAVRNNSAVVSWQELFNLNMFEDKLLEVSFWERLNFLGRNIVLKHFFSLILRTALITSKICRIVSIFLKMKTTIDLSNVKHEKTHKMRLNLEEGKWNSQLFVLLTISGTGLVNTFVDLDEYWDTQNKLESAWYQFKDDFTDVGWLTITAYGAKGLSSNDCYCVFGLENDRLQTQTEFKTNNPNWMKILTFTITDVTSILEVIVYDEKKSEEVGRVSIPLLEIQNGKAKWYALKDSTLRDRAKGNNPRILLEMKCTWDLLRASIRVINPKEPNYLETERKFDRHLFARNLSRAKIVVAWVLDAFQVIKTCFEWESRKWNMIALSEWLLFCWFFKMWMVPLLIIVPFAWYRPPEYFLFYWKKYLKKQSAIEENDEKKEEKATTLSQKINSLVEMVQVVQNFIGEVATLGERIKNLFQFKVPFLSYLTIFIILVVAFVMYLIPFQYILMGWGVHKFTRKLLRPNRIANNELLDLVSRVPDDEILLDCEELPLEKLSEDDNNI